MEEQLGEDASTDRPLESLALDAAVRRACGGDGRAFDDIYRTLSGPLFSYLLTQTRRREDAEDLTGQVFLEAMRGIRGFSGDGSAFKGWLFRIGHNRAVDLARRLGRRPETTLDALEGLAGPIDTAERALAGVEVERLRRAVRALPEQQRRVLTLRLAAGLSSREIAEVLGKRIGTVKALQHRALLSVSRALGASSESTDRPDPAL